MALPDTFARRKRDASGSSDPLLYDIIPKKIRVQVLHILEEAIGIQTEEPSEKIYEIICKFMRKELGSIKLSEEYDFDDEFKVWFLDNNDADECLVAIELIFRVIAAFESREHYQKTVSNLRDRILEINARIFEAGIGYQFESGKLIQVDSQLAHKEIVVPALHLLSAPGFEAAEHEFMDPIIPLTHVSSSAIKMA